MRMGLGLGLSRGRRRGISLDADAAAYIAAVETADGESLEAGVKTAINDFVAGCKSDGIWDAIKASCILAGARTLNGCLVPLRGDAPTNFNFVSADYNRVTGLKGDGSTKYLDSNRSNNADPQNNQHLSVWKSENHSLPANGLGLYIGAGATGSGASQIGRSGSSLSLEDEFSRSRSSSGSLVGPDDPLTGLTGITRSNASEYTHRTSGSDFLLSVGSQESSSDSLFIFRRNGSSGGFANARLSFYSIGESLDLALLDARVSALMTALDGAIA